ncbi:uncharacterized protein [Leptinotarsa decemlineata]|uniref:uncharacterized protein n=1 Tax=Leptinotarsa decemlineata TaxID=7539 RepID=UPI003D30A9D2
MRNLKVCHINTRSIQNGFLDFKDKVHNIYDIITVSETWLNENISNHYVHLEGYQLFRKDRLVGRGGGDAIYIKNSLKASSIDYSSSDALEQVWITFTIHKVKYAVASMYRPPNVPLPSFLTGFEDSLSSVCPKFENVICAGDMNIDFSDSASRSCIQLSEIIESFGLKQIVDQPTRFSTTSCKIIDVIICSELLTISDCTTVDCSSFSDHFLVSCRSDIANMKENSFIYTFRDFRKFNPESFHSDLNNTNFQPIYNSDNIDEKVAILNKLVLELFDKHSPVKTVKISRKKAPWITDNLKLMFKLRDDALSRFKKTKSPHHWVYYKELRNLTNRTVNLEKKAYLNYCLSKSKQLWKELAKLNVYKKKGQKTIPEHLSDVEKINSFFGDIVNSISTPDDDTINLFLSSKLNDQEFKFHETNDNEIYTILLSIKSNAVGPDNISIQMLLYCCPIILPHICHLFNYCIQKNIYPTIWKHSHIIPLAKIGNAESLTDLRPISILCAISKAFEKFVNLQIRSYLNDFSILPTCQSGFRPNHSCSTALLKVVDDLHCSIDNNKLCLLVLLDYSKAFDRINHSLLLAILKYLGFASSVVTLLGNYLTNRSQCVILNNKKSNTLKINNGFPQGSILGPLLFVLYTSQFSHCLRHTSMRCYADDTQLYLQFDENSLNIALEQMSHDLHSLITESSKYCLSVNPTKSCVMLFGRPNAKNRCTELINISIDGVQLPKSDVTKNLGLYLDNSLRFTTHVSQILRKGYMNLKLVYSNKNLLNKTNKILLCDALVLSHANYADTVYGPGLLKSDRQRLQKLQNSCIRLVTGVRRREHVSQYLKQLGWLNMDARRTLHSASLFHKVISTGKPAYLFTKLSFRTDVHNLNLRFKHLLTAPKHKTSFFRGSFSYNIAHLYNRLPIEFKSLSPLSFKKNLKRFMLQSGSLLL